MTSTLTPLTVNTYKTTDGIEVNDSLRGESINTTLTCAEWRLLDEALNHASGRDGYVIYDEEDNEYEIDEDEYIKLWSSLYSKLNNFDLK